MSNSPAIAASTADTLGAIQAATTSAGALQGSIMWWSLEDSEVPAASFRSLWEQQGFPVDLLPEVPPPARAMRDAGQETLKGHGNKRGEYLLRPAGEAGGDRFYALVNEARRAAGTNDYKQDATFQVKQDGTVLTKVTVPACQPTVDSVIRAYNRIYGTFQARDIRAAITALTLNKMAAVSLRGHGGLYWVPAAFQADLVKLQAVVEQTGSSTMTLLPIHSTLLSSQGLGRAARKSLEEQISTLKTELDGWSMEVAHGDGPRPSTVSRRIEDFADLRAKAQMYRDILSLQTDDIEAKLAAAEQQAAKILLGIDVLRG